MTAAASVLLNATAGSLFALVARAAGTRRGLGPFARPIGHWCLAGGVAACAVGGALTHGSPVTQIAIASAAICAATDILTGYVFDAVLAVAGAALAPALFLGGESASSLLGAVAGFGIMVFIYVCSGRRGLGFGDVKLSAIIGAGLGVERMPEALIVAWSCGAVVAVALLLSRTASRASRIAFAPFLAIGTFVACVR